MSYLRGSYDFKGWGGGEKPIHLLYINKHINVITNLTAEFSTGYYCNIRNVKYQNASPHVLQCRVTYSQYCSKSSCDNTKNYIK